MTEENSTVAEGVPTSAPAEIVESAVDTAVEPATEPANDRRDVWDIKVEEDKPEEKPEVPQEEVKETEKPAAEAKEAEKTAETTPEDEVLEEIFAEKSDEKAQEDKTADVDKMTPEEALNLQRNAAGKEYLKRAERVYQPLKSFKYGEIAPDELNTQLSEFLGTDKTAEYAQFAAHSLVDANPEAAFQRAYALTMLQKDPNWDYRSAKIPSLAELTANNGQLPQNEPQTRTLDELTKDLDKELAFDWRDPQNDGDFVDERELLMANTLRAIEAKAVADSTTASELQAKLEKAEKDLAELSTGKQSQEQIVFRGKLEETYGEYRTGIESRLLPHLLRNAGLEPSKDDIPEIAAFKQKKAALFNGSTQKESPFEQFAYQESSVKSQIEQVMTRIITAQSAEAAALLKGDKPSARKAHESAQEESIPLIRLLGQAGKEFIDREIKPEIELFGRLSGRSAQPQKQASARKEVVSTSSNTKAPAAISNARTSEDVFANVVKQVEAEARLNANA